MKYLTLLTIAFIAFSCDVSEQKSKEPVIMAYYVPENPYVPENIPVEKLSHIIFSFTKVIDGEMKFRNPAVQSDMLHQLVEQKSRNPKLKVMIACGGWGADGFSDMAMTEESRARFVTSASKFIAEYKLDGLDIDWEYPSISGAGTMARPEDRRNFTLLMHELRESLDKLERPQTLTFASAGWKRYYDNIELEQVMEVTDFMNVMTYDQVSGVSIYTGHHTPLGAVTNEEITGTPMSYHLDSVNKSDIEKGWATDPHPHSTEKIIDYLIDLGLNPGQLVIGAAFYGRAWKGVSPDYNGLYQLSKGTHKAWYGYKSIREQIETDSTYQRYWDNKAKAAYFYNKRDSIMISYDDTVSVRLKMKYAIQKDLGGMMFWQLGNDTKDGEGLLDAIYEASN